MAEHPYRFSPQGGTLRVSHPITSVINMMHFREDVPHLLLTVDVWVQL